MTEFKVEVVRIGAVERLSNSDTLSITQVHGGYPCIIKTGAFAPGDLAVYVPVDALVPVAHPAFAFLDSGKGRTHERITARRLRGTFSMGLLVEAPSGANVGDDVAAALGVLKYVPPAELEDTPTTHPTGTRVQRLPKSAPWWKRLITRCFPNAFRKRVPICPVYDIDGLRKFKHVLRDGEGVVITEKVHGCNFRAIWQDGRLHIGSRTVWGRDASSNWGRIAEKYNLARVMKSAPGFVLLGEIYGDVQDLKYGLGHGIDFRVFDILELKTRTYVEHDVVAAFCARNGLQMVPELYRGPWHEGLTALAEGKTTLGGGHVREGIVIKAVPERRDSHFGRVILKLHGEGYLTRKGQS